MKPGRIHGIMIANSLCINLKIIVCCLSVTIVVNNNYGLVRASKGSCMGG